LKTDLLEKGVSIVIMLFILSMIAERFVTWVKIYFGKKGRSLPGFSDKNDDLRSAPKSKEEEKAIEVKVLGLNIVLSIVIACIAHANLFDILNFDIPFNSLGWSTVTWTGVGNFLLMILGCILTGFFISLGSKFWHDLLDLLLYTKNLKQKLSSQETYEVTSADQLTEFLNFTESDLVRLAITQNEGVLRAKFSNIHFLSDSIAIIDGKKKPVVGVHLYDTITAGLPDKVPVKLPSGATYQVLTEIIADSGLAKISGGMDGSIANSKSSGFKGSACCVVKDVDEKMYVLTNCHVLTEGDLQNPLFDTNNDTVLYNGRKTGTWFYGTMESRGDFALVQLTDGEAFLNDNEVELFENKFKKVDKEDFFTEVEVRGRISNTTGFILDCVEDKVGIEYNLGNTIFFKKVILLGNQPDKKTCEPVTDFGDSGGAVYDKDKKLIGIITGKNNRFTVVLPVHSFLNNHSLQLL